MANQFPLTSDESELLLLFEELEDIGLIGEALGKDQSGVSRSIKRLAEKTAVLEKRLGRWRITELGVQLNSVSRNTIQAQRALLKSQQRIRIGSNREFVTRVLAPRLHEISDLLGSARIDFLSFESGVEQAVKSGQIDFGFDCGRPVDPAVAYKLTTPEPIAPFCSKVFLKKYREQIAENSWHLMPHVLCERLYPDRVMNLSQDDWNIFAHVNDIAAAREIAIQGFGWSLLPCYAVQREVNDGELVMMADTVYSDERYGVWWLRDRKYIEPATKKIIGWLKGISLSV